MKLHLNDELEAFGSRIDTRDKTLVQYITICNLTANLRIFCEIQTKAHKKNI